MDKCEACEAMNDHASAANAVGIDLAQENERLNAELDAAKHALWDSQAELAQLERQITEEKAREGR